MIRTLPTSLNAFSGLRKAVIGAAAAITMMGAAEAATVNISGTVAPPTGLNNFAAQLTAALGSAVLLESASLTTGVGVPVRLTFTAVGAESGYKNSFTAVGAGTLNETGPNFGFPNINLLTTVGIGSVTGVFSGLLDGLLSFTNNLGPSNVLIGVPGSAAFGVFVSGGAGKHSVFFLAFDDGAKKPDDNHDDFLIRVNVSQVPLPAGGLLLIGGLGALTAMRRRKATAV